MIETSPRVSESSFPRDDQRRSTPSFGLRATCFVFVAATLVLISMVYQADRTLNDTNAKLALAQTDSDQAKNAVQQANSKAADLQRQLTAATAQTAGLQSQLNTARTQTTDLQSQLDKAKNLDSDLQAQLTAERSHLSDALAKLTQENEGSVQLRKDLDASKAQAAGLQSQLDGARSPQAAAQAPVLATMPLRTAFERGFWRSDYTLHIKNMNADPLNVTITVNSSSRIPPVSTTIKAGGTYSVSKLSDGSDVVITSEGFGPVDLTVH